MPSFDLTKSVAKAKFTLEKKKIPNTRASVVLNLDVSGSAKGLFNSGLMQHCAQIVAGLAINLDDNGNLDIFTFADTDHYTTQIQPGMTAANYANYVQERILNGSVPLWGGTHYAQIIKANLKMLGFYKSGFFGTKLVSDNGSGYPALIMTLTDGENFDQPETLKILAQCQDAKVNAYFLFIGVGSADFRNIIEAGDRYSNVGFLNIQDLNKFIESDDAYSQLLPDELVAWFKSTSRVTA
jgi:hypothetical protein